MSKSAIYWGTFLITIGTLLLFNKFNTIAPEFSVFISLWPLFLIFWGLSIIHFPEQIRKILTFLSALFLALFIFAVLANGLHYTKGHFLRWKKHHSSRTVERAKDEKLNFEKNIVAADLNINFGVGSLSIADADDSVLAVNGEYFELERNSIPGNANRTELILSSASDGHFLDKFDNDYEINVYLPKYLDWYIDANIGAAEADLDFSNLKTHLLKIDCGACDLSLKLGMLCKMQEIDIKAGASDISIALPKNAGCRIVSNIFLSDIDIDGFTQINNSWQTANYSAAVNKIEINLDGGVSDFNISRY